MAIADTSAAAEAWRLTRRAEQLVSEVEKLRCKLFSPDGLETRHGAQLADSLYPLRRAAVVLTGAALGLEGAPTARSLAAEVVGEPTPATSPHAADARATRPR